MNFLETQLQTLDTLPSAHKTEVTYHQLLGLSLSKLLIREWLKGFGGGILSPGTLIFNSKIKRLVETSTVVVTSSNTSLRES